jgi:hypothetical protein
MFVLIKSALKYCPGSKFTTRFQTLWVLDIGGIGVQRACESLLLFTSFLVTHIERVL